MSRPSIAPPIWLTSATGSPVMKCTSFVRSSDSYGLPNRRAGRWIGAGSDMTLLRKQQTQNRPASCPDTEPHRRLSADRSLPGGRNWGVLGMNEWIR